MKIVYECGFGNCNKVYTCEIGFYARVHCRHKTSNGTLTEWYPVRILKLEN